MKQTMKYLSMAALVVMGAIMASCVKYALEQPQEKTQEVVEQSIVVCTTTVRFDTVATKALTENGVKTFATGDMIAVIYKSGENTLKAESTPLPTGVYGSSATFEVPLISPNENSPIRIIYPAAMAAETVATDVSVNADATINYAALNKQDGTLASLSSNLDLAVYDGNLEGTAFPADPALKNKLAICIYTLKNSTGASDITSTITGLAISDGTHNYSVNRSAAAGPIYVAIRPTDNAPINYTATDGTTFYIKTVTAKTYAASQMYPLGLRMATSSIIDLATLPADFTAQHNNVLTGSLGDNYKISIADGATVTLDGVTINGENNNDYTWAGLTCLGDATIILKDGTTNTVKGFYEDYPGIQPAKRVGEGEEYTLTVSGTGALMASSNGYGAGIGGGYQIACGNISISGGTVTATGGEKAAGIGSCYEGSCGNIRITGGTVNAIGGGFAAGIGSGFCGSCNNIAITSDVTSVTATKGHDSENSIGAGYYCSCGTIYFGDTTVYNGTAWSPNPMVVGNYGGLTLAISTTTNTDDTWTLTPIQIPEGAIDGLFTINLNGDQVYFSQGNLQWSGTNGWRFAPNQWDRVGSNANNTNPTASNGNYMDLFCWGATGLNGVNPNTSESYLSGSADLSGNNDWGANAITNGGNTANSGWRTLTYYEWLYIFSRTSGSTVNGTTNACYTLATINTDGTGVNGAILFPDGVTIANGEVTSWGVINGASNWGTKCTSAEWTALESKGCVFLPAAGYRMGSSVDQVDFQGCYYSASCFSGVVGAAWFKTSYMTPIINDTPRNAGFAVRLVKDAN